MLCYHGCWGIPAKYLPERKPPQEIYNSNEKQRPFSSSESREILTVVQNVAVKTEKIRSHAIQTAIHRSSWMCECWCIRVSAAGRAL